MRTTHFLIAVAFLACGCQSVEPDPDEVLCPQTYEFGNDGCARIVLVLGGPPRPWPARYRWDIRGRAVRPEAGFDLAVGSSSVLGFASLQLTRWVAPPTGGDTASVWVIARLLEDPRPVVVGVPLPVVGADSVLHVGRFSSVGSRPSVDTVRLTLCGP